jgi:4-hydroxy-L-threonine phosphate dehydrogenase PdxA
MNYKPILIVAGEPNSIFLEIFFKSIRVRKFKSPIILITSKKLLILQMKKLKFKKKIKILDRNILERYKLDNNFINLVDVPYKFKKPFEKISSKSNSFIKESFNVAFTIINNGFTNKLINGPISKKTFLSKKFLGITEYISKKFSVKKKAMLIYNDKLAVSPISTHLPIKLVKNYINKKNIIENITLVNSFYRNNIGIKPRIGILGLNPHCETIHAFDEDNKIIKPAVKHLKRLKYRVTGPLSADTIFLKDNRKNFDVIVGM